MQLMEPLSMRIIIRYLIKVTTMQDPAKSVGTNNNFSQNDSHKKNTVKPQKNTIYI